VLTHRGEFLPVEFDSFSPVFSCVLPPPSRAAASDGSPTQEISSYDVGFCCWEELDSCLDSDFVHPVHSSRFGQCGIIFH
jgi:hypothetical protein